MKLDEEQMEIIEKANLITGCYSSVTEETHWLNDEEAYYLIENLVEIIDSPLNNQINELHKKLNAQDKITNTQALEISRLKEENLEISRLRPMIDLLKEENNGVRKSFNDLQQRIEKALFSIEFYKNVSVNWDNMSNKEKDEYVLAILNDFSKVLGDKE